MNLYFHVYLLIDAEGGGGAKAPVLGGAGGSCWGQGSECVAGRGRSHGSGCMKASKLMALTWHLRCKKTLINSVEIIKTIIVKSSMDLKIKGN